VRRAVALVLVVFGLVACGGGSDLDPRAARDLQTRVDSIRSAADSGDVESAQLALGELERAVARWQRRGDLSADRASQILFAAREVADALGAIPPAAPSPSASSEPSKPPEHHDEGKHHGPDNPENPPGHEGD
jgi:hypothetical protein